MYSENCIMSLREYSKLVLFKKKCEIYPHKYIKDLLYFLSYT